MTLKKNFMLYYRSFSFYNRSKTTINLSTRDLLLLIAFHRFGLVILKISLYCEQNDEKTFTLYVCILSYLKSDDIRISKQKVIYNKKMNRYLLHS